MKAFKAREVRKPVIEHLYTIGYKSEANLDTLVDSPYIISFDGILHPTPSVSISSGKMRIIMDWMDKNCPAWNDYNFGYTDYNENKKRYGTSKPCIKLF